MKRGHKLTEQRSGRLAGDSLCGNKNPSAELPVKTLVSADQVLTVDKCQIHSFRVEAIGILKVGINDYSYRIEVFSYPC